MADFLPTVVIVGFFGAVMAGLVVAATRRRGRHVASSVAGPFEEIWHPAAHRARIEIQLQDERLIEPASPGDPPLAGDWPGGLPSER